MLEPYFDSAAVRYHTNVIEHTVSPVFRRGEDIDTYGAKDYYYCELADHFELPDSEDDPFGWAITARALRGIKRMDAAKWKDLNALKRHFKQSDENNAKLADLEGIANRKVDEDQAVERLRGEDLAEGVAKLEVQKDAAKAETVENETEQSGCDEQDGDLGDVRTE